MRELRLLECRSFPPENFSQAHDVCFCTLCQIAVNRPTNSPRQIYFIFRSLYFCRIAICGIHMHNVMIGLLYFVTCKLWTSRLTVCHNLTTTTTTVTATAATTTLHTFPGQSLSRTDVSRTSYTKGFSCP